MSRPRITDRQPAVLAAVERRRSATLLDLRPDFPALMPSATCRVLRRLEELELLVSEGERHTEYIGGVRWFPPEAVPNVSSGLARLEAYLLAQLEGLDVYLDSARGSVVISIPYHAVASGLTGHDERLDAVRQVLSGDLPVAVDVSILTETEYHVPSLRIVVRPLAAYGTA
jgi:hypothetical protein